MLRLVVLDGMLFSDASDEGIHLLESLACADLRRLADPRDPLLSELLAASHAALLTREDSRATTSDPSPLANLHTLFGVALDYGLVSVITHFVHEVGGNEDLCPNVVDFQNSECNWVLRDPFPEEGKQQ